MAIEGMKIWSPAGIYRGLFDGYVMIANKHVSLDQTAWHVRVHLASGDSSHREYWVVGEEFHRTLRQLVSDSGMLASELGEIINDVNPEERIAVMKAIDEWKSAEPIS